jgi:hypothetical protein
MTKLKVLVLSFPDFTDISIVLLLGTWEVIGKANTENP